MKTAIELIADERRRQIEVEGWTQEHDKSHTNGELATAAACYAIAPKYREAYRPEFRGITSIVAGWPWASEWWKPSPDDRIKELKKAGALIVAEIERLLNEKEETGDAPIN